MEEVDYSELTPTELLKVGNDIKSKHDKLKSDIMYDLQIFDEIRNRINQNISILNDMEKKYVTIVEILSK